MEGFWKSVHMTCLPCQPWSCAELSLLTRPACRHKRCQPEEMIHQKRKLQVIELISFLLNSLMVFFLYVHTHRFYQYSSASGVKIGWRTTPKSIMETQFETTRPSIPACTKGTRQKGNEKDQTPKNHFGVSTFSLMTTLSTNSTIHESKIINWLLLTSSAALFFLTWATMTLPFTALQKQNKKQKNKNTSIFGNVCVWMGIPTGLLKGARD